MKKLIAFLLLASTAFAAADFPLVGGNASTSPLSGQPYYLGFRVIRDKASVLNSSVSVQYSLDDGAGNLKGDFDANGVLSDLSAAERSQIQAILKKLVCADVVSRFPGKACQ